MTAEVSRSLLMSAAHAVGFPAITLGALSIEGETAWREAARRAVSAERVQLVAALLPALMVATEGGRERLAAWGGGEHRRDVEGDLCTYGDTLIAADVRAAVALLPAPVRQCALTEIAFLGVGRESKAWTLAATFCTERGARLPRVVVLGPEAGVFLVLHEIAHVWLARPSCEAVAITTAGEEGLVAHASVEGWAHRIHEEQETGDVLADALAFAWLYAVPDARRPA